MARLAELEAALQTIADACNSPSTEELDQKLVKGISLALSYLDRMTLVDIVGEATGVSPEAFLEDLSEYYKKHEIIHFNPTYHRIQQEKE